MAKIYHKEFKRKLDQKNKILWSNEPRHENKYKTNLKKKRIFFRESLENYHDNQIIKKCDRSFDICAIKYAAKKIDYVSTLVLQEYAMDDEDIITWEYLLYNKKTEVYDDSKFFKKTEEAYRYFIDKTSDIIDN
tara:strand:+ start:59 stop:460 length:402 start_codon:yes stop_codon:yes gene_type:complete